MESFFLLHTVLIAQTLDFKKETSAKLESLLLKYQPFTYLLSSKILELKVQLYSEMRD